MPMRLPPASARSAAFDTMALDRRLRAAAHQVPTTITTKIIQPCVAPARSQGSQVDDQPPTCASFCGGSA